MMAGRVAQLALDHGLDNLTTGEQQGSRRTSVDVTGPHGLRLTMAFNGNGPHPQADTYVLSWYGVEPGWRLAPDAFGNVNPHHGHKATDVVHGFRSLENLLARRFAAIADGTAFLEREPQAAEPGRVLVIGCDSGWRTYLQGGGAGDLVLPYPATITRRDPRDMGVFHDVRVFSIRAPR
jgi:hypothetical protein